MTRYPAQLLGAVLLFSLAAAPPAAATEVQSVVSPGGIEAWLVEDHSNPIIAMNFAFRGGAALDPLGKEGLATMVSGLLDEGAGGLDSLAFRQRLEDRSITLSFDASHDVFRGTLRFLTRDRDEALDLLRLAITVPRFDPEPVERIRSQILAGLRHDLEDLNSIAQRAWWSRAFDGHPYARPSDGTIEGVEAITTEDLEGFVKDRLGKDNLLIGVVGDITPEALAQALDHVFGALPENATPWQLPDVVADAPGGVTVVQRPVPQSVVVFGQPGLRREDPDFYAAFVMNYILGGGSFNSRLMVEVREKRGLAYSVYSRLVPFDHTALIIGGVGTQNALVAKSIELIRAEWQRMAADGVTEPELADAKRFLTGSYPLRFSSTGGIARILLGVQLDRLGMDYIDKRNSLIEAVTVDDIKRAARRFLDADRLTFVVVGAPEGLQEG